MTDPQTRFKAFASRPGILVKTDSKTGLHVAGLLALLPTVGILLIRIGINAPFAPQLPYSSVYDQMATAALLGPATGAILVSVTTDDDVRRVALAFAGVFGLLSAVATAAVVPASITIVLATAALVVASVRRPFSADTVREGFVGILFLAGVVLSMAGSLGVEPATTRSLGSKVGLLAIATAPVFVEWSRKTAFVGVLAGAGFAGIGLSAPFVTGAASLVGGGIVGVSLPVMLVAVIGGVTVITTGIERLALHTTLAGLLILTAGVPATVPRGLALLVGLAILLGGRTNP